MFRHFFGTVLGLTLGSAALGAVVTSVDLVDAADGIDLPPAGVACVDVMVDLTTPGDEWTAGGIDATTANGATFAYRLNMQGVPNLRNPNSGNPVGNRTIFATSVGHPAARSDVDARFSFADVGVPGCYSCHPPPAPQTTPTLLDFAWFRTPDGRVDVDGAVARIAVNLPPGITADQITLTIGTSTPPATHPLALLTSVGQGSRPGTVNASVMFPSTSGTNWVVSAVPEPATLSLTALGALLAMRRR